MDGCGTAGVQRPVWVAVDVIGMSMWPMRQPRAAMIDASGCVITLVGSVPPHREKGDKNGAGSTARLSSPRAVAVTYDGTWGDPAALIIYVADTDNHRIRKVTGGGITTPTNVQVTCFAGRCGKGTNDYRDSLQDAAPEPGYADGFGTFARFDAPRGLAVHHESGDVIIADTNNHAIRKVNATRFVFTIAGQIVRKQWKKDVPLLVFMVLLVTGRNSSIARFEYPKSVAIDEPSSNDASTTDYVTSVQRKQRRTR